MTFDDNTIKAFVSVILALITVIPAVLGALGFKRFKNQKANGGTTYDMVRKLLDKIEKLEKELTKKKDKGAK